MLDPAFVRDHLEDVRSGLRNRGLDPDKALEEIATLETARRRLHPRARGAEARSRTRRATRSRARSARARTRRAIQEANRRRAQQIKQLGVQLDSIEHQRNAALLVAAEPAARDRAGRQERRGQRRGAAARRRRARSTSTPQAHWDLGPALGIIDFERAARISPARASRC